MIPAIANHLWQSTLFAAATGLLMLPLRRNRAHVRHWLWLAASVKFLIPFSLLISLGSHAGWRTATQAARTSAIIEQIGQPFVATPLPLRPVPGAPSRTPEILLGLWACGFASVFIFWSRRWTRMRADVRAASPLDLQLPVLAKSSATLREPGVFGLLRPILLLPQGITERLTPEQLQAILAHELCHVRRRDNLAAAIHMVVEAVFWFHPLVWWMGARLVDERERACDEEVLRQGSDPQVYAEGILNVCKFYMESPLVCVSGVTGSHLKRRIETIMTNRMPHRLNIGKKLLLATAGVAAVTGPIAMGVLSAQPQVAIDTSTSGPEFEVATIKPTALDYQGPTGLGGSKGRLTITHYTVKQMMKFAYVLHPDQVIGPDWIDQIRYDVNAKLPEGVGGEANIQRMIRKLMADRFALKFHRETRQMPAYSLTVAKGGPKLHERGDGDGGPGYSLFFNGPRLPARKATMPQLVMGLQGLVLDHPVIDETGLKGTYDFDLEWTPDESQFAGRGGIGPYAGDPNGPSIYDALQEQLGLKLTGTKAQVEVLIVDRVDKPSEN